MDRGEYNSIQTKALKNSLKKLSCEQEFTEFDLDLTLVTYTW